MERCAIEAAYEVGVCTLRSARDRTRPRRGDRRAEAAARRPTSRTWWSAFVSPHHADAYEALPGRLAAGVPARAPVRLLGGGRHRRRPRGRRARGAVADRGVAAGRQVASARLRRRAQRGADAAPRRGARASASPPTPIRSSCSSPIRSPSTPTPWWPRLDAAYPSGRKIGGMASGGSGPGQNALWPDEQHAARRRGRCRHERQHRGRHHRGAGLPADRRSHAGHARRRPRGARARRQVARRRDARASTTRSTSATRSCSATRSSSGSRCRSGNIEFQRRLPGAQHRRRRSELGRARRRGDRAAIGRCCSSSCATRKTAETDLSAQLERFRGPQPAGALLFSCVGRGQGLFGRADHDTDLFRARVGAVPLGGFFCNGEIGPVGGHTFLHGYTSAFGLFRHK